MPKVKLVEAEHISLLKGRAIALLKSTHSDGLDEKDLESLYKNIPTGVAKRVIAQLITDGTVVPV